MLGIETVGSDCDPQMVAGCRLNISVSNLMAADATRLPLCDRSVDAVVTDFPYGQSVCIKKDDTVDRLYDDTLSEIGRVLKTGKRAVVVTHRDISSIAGRHMRVIQQHRQRVHKSLTRLILVLEK
jgi:tRNA (guanine10-N2)-dimethyltransferase